MPRRVARTSTIAANVNAGCPYPGLAGNLPRVRHRPVPGFAAGKDACGRAWGQDAPARPGESRWRLGPGFGWGLGSVVGYAAQGPSTGSGRTGVRVLWLGLLSVAHGVPSYVDVLGNCQ